MTPKIERVFVTGLIALLDSGTVAMLYQSFVNNEPLMGAMTKPETLYVAGACGLLGVIFQSVANIAPNYQRINKKEESERERRLKEYRAQRGR